MKGMVSCVCSWSQNTDKQLDLNAIQLGAINILRNHIGGRWGYEK